ncbi:hypothetical protein CHU95_03275 [Niveispirillum lacus]|uniref:Uncharacterized protein n=1 Tax=Niveispirillum lacus TaxID=1981099 RepID=A0A255Z5S2_9PROT|nr:hypothetical protein CHU95_03275 [Niveispirillum lacus]
MLELIFPVARLPRGGTGSARTYEAEVDGHGGILDWIYGDYHRMTDMSRILDFDTIGANGAWK